MDWNKFLNVLLFALLFTILFQWFLGPQKEVNPVSTNSVFLSITDDTTVIPNIPHIEISNTTSGSVTIDPCKDIGLFIDSVEIKDIAVSAPAFCTSLILAPSEKKVLPLGSLASLFAKQPGKYIVKLTHNSEEKIITFTHSAP
jgi:hypothetical protein